MVGEVRATADWGEGVDMCGGLRRGGPISDDEELEFFLTGDFLVSFSCKIEHINFA